jgi:predicted DNA-binding protein
MQKQSPAGDDKIQTAFRLPAGMIRDLKDQAYRESKSVALLVQEILADYLAEKKKRAEAGELADKLQIASDEVSRIVRGPDFK